MITKLLIGVVALGALGGGGYFVIAKMDEAAKAEADAGMTLDVQRAQMLSFDINTTAGGELQARTSVELRSRVESQTTIVEIIPEGTRVTEGDVLVRLNSDALRTEIEEELLRVESAKADLIAAEQALEIQKNENESALRKAKLAVEIAQIDLTKWEKGDVPQKQMELQHALDRAQRQHERLDDQLKKTRELFEAKFESADTLKEHELAFRQAEADLASAEKALLIYNDYTFNKEEKQKNSDLAEARAELERVERRNTSQLASKEADLTNRKRQLAMRQERLREDREELEACTVTAPQDGLVVYGTSIERNRWGGGEGPFQVGTQVYNNQLLIVLPDTSEMMATVRVHESLAGRVRPGQPATIKVEALGGRTYEGEVESIGVLAEGGGWRDPNLREYTVRIALNEDAGKDGALKPSMRVESEITLGRVDDALSVPLAAVFNKGMLRYVHIDQGDGRFVRRPVRVGRRSEQFAEIVAGVEAGERVLVRDPSAGELLNTPWDAEELAAVGLAMNERGEITRAERRSSGPRGAQPGSARGDATSTTQPASATKTSEAATLSADVRK